MSDNVLSIIPTEPRWQPGHEQAEHARLLLAELAPDPDRDESDLKAAWHETITVVPSWLRLVRPRVVAYSVFEMQWCRGVLGGFSNVRVLVTPVRLPFLGRVGRVGWRGRRLAP